MYGLLNAVGGNFEFLNDELKTILEKLVVLVKEKEALKSKIRESNIKIGNKLYPCESCDNTFAKMVHRNS